jgi:uncharacterized protein (DUF362 family)
MYKESTVAIARGTSAFYPSRPPFHPEPPCPEAELYDAATELNPVYTLMCNLFLLLDLDRANAGTSMWNPLGEIIRPGDRVVVKPNLVHHGSKDTKGGNEALLTHGSVVRVMLDFVLRALKGRGEVTVGDAPLQSGDFSQIAERTGLKAVVDYLAPRAGVPVRLVDFRQECVSTSNIGGYIIRHKELTGEASGYRVVDVGAQSALAEIEGDYERYRVTDYVPDLMREHQAPGRHQYVIPQVLLNADVVINIPKLKTHRKAGLTCALKNLVGINGRKDCLPHHRKGSHTEGGDEFLNNSILKKAYSWCDEASDVIPLVPLRLAFEMGKHLPKLLARLLAKDPYFEGSWYGNDTVWRMVHDLNRILRYGDTEGRLCDEPTRRVIHIVDAIVAGEGEGPLEPSPVRCGTLLGGASPLAIDAVAATLMGFDLWKLPIVARGFGTQHLPLGPKTPGEIEVVLPEARMGLEDMRRHVAFRFRPPACWMGHIELEPDHDAPPVESILA